MIFVNPTSMIYSKTILDRIRDQLVNNHQTIAVAESVTSGHLQAALSTADDAALFFQGGITTYNLGQKCRHLSVEPLEALAHDCVSENTTAEMAKNVCRLFLSHYGVGVTGYATPSPEKGIHELFAYLTIAREDKIIFSKKLLPGNGTAFDAQVMYTNQALEELCAVLATKIP